MSSVKKLRTPKPATAAETSSRIGNVLRFLPMSTEDLRANVVLHEADAEAFDSALGTALLAGAVAVEGDWLRLQPMETAS